MDKYSQKETPSLSHNADVQSGTMSRLTMAALGIVLLSAAPCADAVPVAVALTQALHGTQATAVVLELQTGAILASAGRPRRGSPGSTIKPLLLQYALEHGIVLAGMQVYCRRDLHVGARSLPCTHPADNPVFTAESALAESCNTWFAEMARRFPAPALELALAEYHLQHTSVTMADVEQRQLTVLGLAGVSASPLELAQAYRRLFQRMTPNGPVAQGLRDSVTSGMADPAAVSGVTILGKTGTASDPSEQWTHGWFAGAIPGQFVIVVYVPRGDGGIAARLAQRFFKAIKHEERSQ